jgi:hypothetical protein
MSLAVMDDWAGYVFRTAESVLGDKFGNESDDAAAFSEIKAFCAGRTHDIWGASADDLNPSVVFQYDIDSWMRAPLSAPLFEFKVDEPVVFEFGFSPSKQVERAALIQRYGTTPTGIGRIIIQMGRNRIWREPLPLQGFAPQSMTTAAARRWPT